MRALIGERGFGMPKKRQTVEEIIGKLREAEAKLERGLASFG